MDIPLVPRIRRIFWLWRYMEEKHHNSVWVFHHQRGVVDEHWILAGIGWAVSQLDKQHGIGVGRMQAFEA